MQLSRLFAKYGLYLPAAWIQAGNVSGYLKDALESQHWDRERLHEHQTARLAVLLDHARHHVPYYHSLPGDFGAGTPTADQLTALPCLTKADLQSRHAELRSRDVTGRLVWKTSGGSTGQPVTVAKTRDAMARELAATWRGYSWAGIGMGDSQARFWGVPMDQGARLKAGLTDFVCNRIRLSAFDFNAESLAGYVGRVNAFAPDYFYGYASMLVEFAEYLKREGLSLDRNPRAIISTSEVLTDQARRTLEETFSTRVYNEYGCGELGTIAHECEDGRLHLSEENMIVEILDGEVPCSPGQPGELVVTELNNLGMPLIRYRTGDFGTLDDAPCSCGRTLRVLRGLHGRAYDIIRTRDGKAFHGEFMLYIFEDIKRKGLGIRQFQVVQTDWNAFLVRLVTGTGFSAETEDFVRRRIHEEIDPAAVVTFERVTEIVREKSGKMRLIVGLDRALGQTSD